MTECTYPNCNCHFPYQEEGEYCPLEDSGYQFTPWNIWRTDNEEDDD